MSLTKDYSPTGVGTEREYDDVASPRDRGMDDFILENELADYADTYGEESLAVKLDQFMLQRSMY